MRLMILDSMFQLENGKLNYMVGKLSRNFLLSESGKWTNHEAIILVSPEIHPDSLRIKWNLISIRGKGKVVIENPMLQYIASFPLSDGLTY